MTQSWQPDNKDWMKQRKQEWKEISPKIKHLLAIEKEERKVLKDYFLEGKIDPDYPIEKMQIGPLLEMWLHPDHSDEHWQVIKDKYAVMEGNKWGCSRVEFMDMNKGLHGYVPEGESFFSGLEERLCHWFKYDTLRREDWPEWSDEDYMKEAKRLLSYARNFDVYLKDKKPNPYNITRYRVQVWKEAMIVAYEGDYLGLEWMVESLCNVLKAPEKYNDLSVKLAHKIQVVLLDPALPQAAQERIAELKQQYGCKE